MEETVFNVVFIASRRGVLFIIFYLFISFNLLRKANDQGIVNDAIIVGLPAEISFILYFI